MFAKATVIDARATMTLILGLSLPARAYSFAGGTGEPNDPYQIATAEQLVSIGSDPNLLDKHFVLVDDIDLDPNLPGGTVFARAVVAVDEEGGPGYQGTPFTGRFDGNGHKIRNLTVECDFGYYVGLFGYIDRYGRVANLEVENASISGATFRVGTLAGINAGTIQNCHAGGSVSAGTRSYIESLGGLAGENWGRVYFSHALVDVCGGDEGRSIGGLVGTNGLGRIVGCYSRAKVTGWEYLGGLVGTNAESTITDCYAQGAVSFVVPCYYAGGLVGDNLGGVIANSYSTTVLWNGNERWSWGGLIGGNSAMSFGRDTIIQSIVVNSFWDTQVSGASSSNGGTGLSTSSMYQQEAFAGWDFNYAWTMCEGRDYPRLRWERVACEP